MAQQPRISSRFTEGVEDALDCFTAARRDGTIDQEEADRLETLLNAAYQLAMDVDAGFQIGIAILRGGPNSDHAKRLLREAISPASNQLA